jgi:hypothetical protein
LIWFDLDLFGGIYPGGDSWRVTSWRVTQFLLLHTTQQMSQSISLYPTP